MMDSGEGAQSRLAFCAPSFEFDLLLAMRSFTRMPKPVQHPCSAPVALFLLGVLLPRTFLVGGVIAACILPFCIALRRQWWQTRRLAMEQDFLLRFFLDSIRGLPVKPELSMRNEREHVGDGCRPSKDLSVPHSCGQPVATPCLGHGGCAENQQFWLFQHQQSGGRRTFQHLHDPAWQVASDDRLCQPSVESPAARTMGKACSCPIILEGASQSAARQALEALESIDAGEMLCDKAPSRSLRPGVEMDAEVASDTEVEALRPFDLVQMRAPDSLTPERVVATTSQAPRSSCFARMQSLVVSACLQLCVASSLERCSGWTRARIVGSFATLLAIAGGVHLRRGCRAMSACCACALLSELASPIAWCAGAVSAWWLPSFPAHDDALEAIELFYRENGRLPKRNNVSDRKLENNLFLAIPSLTARS